MSWDDQQANCVLEVCCSQGGTKQIEALAEVLEQEASLNKNDAMTTATWLTQNLDFAPKGSLFAFKQRIAELARGNPYE